MKIRDKRGSENVVAYHFSRLEWEEDKGNNLCIQDIFPDELLGAYVNFWLVMCCC